MLLLFIKPLSARPTSEKSNIMLKLPLGPVAMAYQMFPFFLNKYVIAKRIFLQVCQKDILKQTKLSFFRRWSLSKPFGMVAIIKEKKCDTVLTSPPLNSLPVAPQNCRIIFAHPIARNQCRLQTCFEKATTRCLICHHQSWSDWHRFGVVHDHMIYIMIT